MHENREGHSTSRTGHSPEGRLDSWKEIASYLGRGIRTVQRWEREEGLPDKPILVVALEAAKRKLARQIRLREAAGLPARPQIPPT